MQCRQSSHRETDNQLSKNDVRFPKMDMKRLKPEYRAVVQKLQTFARISANRAQRISKLPQKRKARVAEKFEKVSMSSPYWGSDEMLLTLLCSIRNFKKT